MSTTDTTNIDNMGTSRAYKALVDDLIEKMDAGDDLAQRVIGAMALLAEGWRYGDPDPVDPADPDGEPMFDVSYVTVLFRRAA